MRDDELRDQGLPDTYDNTMLSNFATCPRRFYWFSRGLDYKFIPPYFTWGRAFGVALNTWHKFQGMMPKLERIAQAIADAEIEWQKDSPIEEGANTWINLEKTFLLYVQNYGEVEPWHMVYGEGELGFRLPVPGTDFYFGGSIDAPIGWKHYGILGREDKTTGEYITDQYRNQWEQASQITGYFWALRQTIGEEPFGYYMNLISKTHRKESGDRFERLLIKKDEWEVERWLRDTILMVDDIRREWDRWEWPKHGQRDPINCAGGMGRKACLYRRLCLMEAEPWQMEADYNFDQEFNWRSAWVPWEREGENE